MNLYVLIDAAGARVIGMHAHSGSGVQDPEQLAPSSLARLRKWRNASPTFKAIDLGGGLGIPEKPGDKQFDLAQLDAALAEIREAFPQYELWLGAGALSSGPSRGPADAGYADQRQGRYALHRCWYRNELADSAGTVRLLS